MTEIERELLKSVGRLTQQYHEDAGQLRQELERLAPRWTGANEERLDSIEKRQKLLEQRLGALAASLSSLTQSIEGLLHFERSLSAQLNALSGS